MDWIACPWLGDRGNILVVGTKVALVEQGNVHVLKQGRHEIHNVMGINKNCVNKD